MVLEDGPQDSVVYIMKPPNNRLAQSLVASIKLVLVCSASQHAAAFM